MSKYERITMTWVNEPVFTKKQVESITKEASLLTKFFLLFHKSHYSIDENSLIRYKHMNGTTYVMKRGTRL